MTQRKRIFLNIAVTYGRSLYAFALGLFTARWALKALGQTDYGLYGLVGGMVGMVSFLNSILASSVGRFYAVSIGEARKAGNEESGLIVCRQWFNTALSIHTLLPLILVMIGYPVGVWAVEHFLAIPAERVSDCVWVWRFSCITCFVSMVNVPFTAMYKAKQEIAELTLFSLLTTTGNALFLYYMVSHPGVWLSKYAVGTCICFSMPQFAIMIRAKMLYKECRINFRYWFNGGRCLQLGKFACARFWSDFSSVFSRQGQAILVNKYMGAEYNASITIGNTVASHASTLSGALSGAFYPAIGNLCGEGKVDEMRRFCFMTCRFGSALVLVFAIPLSVEIHEVLRLWLATPPDFVAEICLIALARQVFDRMTDGYWMAIYSRGKGVMKYSWTVGWAGISTVFVSWGCFALGMGMWSIIIALGISKCITVGVRLAYGKSLAGLEAKQWFRNVFFPIVLATGSAFVAGSIVVHLLSPSFMRICISTVVCLSVFIPVTWFLLFQQSERTYLVRKIGNVFGRIVGKK